LQSVYVLNVTELSTKNGKLCYIYFPKHAFCGRFSAIAVESDIRNEVGVEHKKRLHTHDDGCSIVRNLSITASLI